MPAKSKSQQRLFSMALAVRKGELKRSEVFKSVLDIVDSDMSNKEIEDFTVLKENNTHRMIPLYDYLIESMEQARAFIKDNIDNISDEDVLKIVEIIRGSDETITNNDIVNYMKDRLIDDAWKLIVLTIKDHPHDYANFIKLIKGDPDNELRIPTSSDLIRSDDIYKLFKDIFSQETLHELCELAPSRFKVTRGAGEILCRLIIKDANNGVGDFSCSLGDIEFKSNGGRLKWPAMLPPIAWNTESERILGIPMKKISPDIAKDGPFSKFDNIDKWFDAVENFLSENKTYTLPSLLAEVLISPYDIAKDKKPQLEELIKNHISELEHGGKQRYQTLIRIIGSLQLYVYHKTCKFDYILVGRPSSPKGHDLKKYVCIPGVKLDSIITIFGINEIYFNTLPRITGGSQAPAVKIWPAN